MHILHMLENLYMSCSLMSKMCSPFVNLLTVFVLFAALHFVCDGVRPRRKQTSDFERGRIVGMIEAGLSQREVSRRTGWSRYTIQRWYDRYVNQGNCDRRHGSGRPRISDARDDRFLTLLCRRNRFASANSYRQQWRTACNVYSSRETVNRRLLAARLHARRPVVRIPLGPIHRANRLQFARDHVLWTQRQWNDVMFTNESRFCLDFNDGRVRVRRLPGERFFDVCVREHDRYGGGSVMFWGGIMRNSRTDLVRVNGTLTGQRYVQEILTPHVLPAAQTYGAMFVFQQDNARPHTACVSANCLQNANINVLQWPSRSPDLSPIEHLWDVLGRRVRDNYPHPPADLGQLAQRLLEQWALIPQLEIRRLIESMQRRMQECIRKRGGHNRY